MKIAVIADTHNKLPADLLPVLAEADEIWHLGDVMDGEIVRTLRGLGPSVIVVRGNNDFEESWPLRVVLERGGKSFLLIHEPPRRPGGADVILHGHTHIPRDEQIGSTRILNPGTIGKPNKGAPPSYAWLEIDESNGTITWRVVLL